MMYPKVKILNVAQQAAGIRSKFPLFEVDISRNSMIINGFIKPTARSCSYGVKIEYTIKKQPVITVTNPLLVRNDENEKIPHMYNQKTLCLYRPKYGEFQYSDYLSNTIIPWTSLWLYHYETWHITGEWKGGGEHPIL